MTESAYKQAGVDIDAGEELVDRIGAHVKRTKRAGVMGGLGGFGALFDLKAEGYKDPILVSSTDGVGTKLKIAIETGMHDSVGIDLVAMCVNDLIVQGATPLFFLDYFASGKLNVDTAERVIAGIAKGCEQAGCALVGGETAEMPGMYAAGDYDLAGFSVGAVERDKMLTGEHVKVGDVVLGLASSGVHSNGYSLVRRLADGLSYNDPAPFDVSKTLGAALLTPTKIYVKPILKALEILDNQGIPAIRALAHITGGGLLKNIPRTIPEHLAVHLDAAAWTRPPVFQWLQDKGNLSPDDMARTFNCGIGMTIICPSSHAAAVKTSLESSGEMVFTIGKVVENKGEAVVIDNMKISWAS
jgi:phosphoribosylformylglycinamidine cyclo-ligase